MKKEKEQPEKGKKKIEKLTDHEMKTWSYSTGFPTDTNYGRSLAAIRKKLDEIINVINKEKGKKKVAKLTDTVGVTDIVKPTVIRKKPNEKMDEKRA